MEECENQKLPSLVNLWRQKVVEDEKGKKEIVKIQSLTSQVRHHVNKINICSRIKSLLSLISLGKYRMQLFYNGSDQYSSIFGGIITIICFTTLIIYSSIIFPSILRKEIYIVDRNYFMIQPLFHKDTQPESLELIYTNNTQ